MSGGFSNPIIGGGGALVYPSIHSPNFVQSPLTGWAIDKNGNAFFQNLTVGSGAGLITVFTQATTPTAQHTGDIWINTSSSANSINIWNGSAWVLYQAGTGAIANLAITAALIANGTITATQIANATITATQIAAAAGITGSQLAAAAGIVGGQIAAATITGGNIAAATITSGLIAADAIVAGLIAAGAIDGFTINGVIINGNTINAADLIIDTGSGNGVFTYGNAVPQVRGTIVNTGFTNQSVSSKVLSVTKATVTGDAIFVSVYLADATNGRTLSSVTDSAGNTYTSVQSINIGSGLNLYQFIALNTTALTTSSTITLTFSGATSGAGIAAIVLDCSGVATAAATDKTATGSGSADSPGTSLSTGVLSQAPELAIGTWSTGSVAGTGGPPKVVDSVFVNSDVTNNPPNLGVFCAYLNATTSVTNTAEESIAVGNNIYGCLVTLKGSSSSQSLAGSVAAKSGTDPITSTAYPAGFTSFLSATVYANLTAALLTFADTVNAAKSGGEIGLTSSGIVGTNDALELLSPLLNSTDVEAGLLLIRALTGNAGIVQINNATLNVKTNVVPGQPASGFYLHSDATGYPRAKVPASGDTNDYQTAHLILTATATPQTISSTSATLITGLSAPVAARKYAIDGILMCTQGATGAIQDFNLSGPSVSADTHVSVAAWEDSATGESVFAADYNGGIGNVSTGGAFNANIKFQVWFKGYITFTASGTFSVNAFEGVNGDPFTITGGRFDLMPV